MTTRATQGQEIVKRAREEIERRTGKTTEQLYAEREKRVNDVIHLKAPDRMPVFMQARFALQYAGIPKSAMFYDRAAYRDALIKTVLDFEPDVMQQNSLTNSPSGLVLEKLGTKEYKWPGGTLRPNETAQFQEEEIMKENEYDLFITDPGDFILRYYLPRRFGALEPLAKLPSLQSLVGSSSMATQSARFSSPEIVQAFKTIFEAGEEQARFEQFEELGRDIGIPPLIYPGYRTLTAPFDTIGDNLRGMRGIMVDIFKQPEKVTVACQRILEWHLARMVPAAPEERGTKRVNGGLSHWGSEEYLSRKQFEKFYWPTCRDLLRAAIDNGVVPVMFPEGRLIDRLDHLLDLQKGNALLFTIVDTLPDAARMKEILGGHMAFLGGVPPSLLWGGSPQEVEEYCKNLIKVCGKGGGYILACRGGEDDAKIENVKAMLDAVRKYGRYD